MSVQRELPQTTHFIIEGKVYKIEEDIEHGGCSGCAFNSNKHSCLAIPCSNFILVLDKELTQKLEGAMNETKEEA